jgi:hypothetical protein
MILLGPLPTEHFNTPARPALAAVGRLEEPLEGKCA